MCLVLAIKNCLKEGVTISRESTILSDFLSGKIIVFTGALELMNRNDAKKIVEANGGTTRSTLTKKTTYLVTGNNAGSKLNRAKELGISTLTEKKFLELIDY